jgi:hypothetical protein
MLMLDVRNAIANILDRYTIADVVEVTLRKMRRDNVNLPFVASPRTKETRRARGGDKRTDGKNDKKPSPLTTPFETGLDDFLYREGI